MIGIRLANNTFFPVLDENGHIRTEGRAARKRLVLTTVADNQETVQIDLYRGDSKNIIDDTYLASLTVENIRSAGAGEPDIELVMGTDEDGQLQARAMDRAGGSENSLSVSLQALPESETYETPDFSIGDDFATPESLGEYQWNEEAGEAGELNNADEPAAAEEKPEQKSEQIRSSYEEPERRRPIGIFILLAVGVIAIAVLAYFLLREKPGASNKAISSGITKPAQAIPAAPAPTPEAPSAPATSKPVTPDKGATGSAAPVATPPAPASTPSANPQVLSRTKDGVWYRIAFGDTLWDLAYSFYNNPRQFDRIAKKNNIANPNRIYGGNRIFIPLDRNAQNSPPGK